MQPTILVPIEDTPQSRRVLPFATALAAAGKGRLVLAQVITDPDLRIHAEEQLRKFAEELTQSHDHVDVVVVVREGSPASVILQLSQELGADLIAMATDRESDFDRWLNDSVVDTVLRLSAVPLVVVPPGCTSAWHGAPAQMVVPLDGSPLAEAALLPALEYCSRLRCDLVLLRAVDNPEVAAQARDYLESVAATLQGRGVRIATQVAFDNPEAAITQAATGMIAMATHGRSGLARLLLGSVASHVLQHATVPILLLRPASLQAVPASSEDDELARSPFLIVA